MKNKFLLGIILLLGISFLVGCQFSITTNPSNGNNNVTQQPTMTNTVEPPTPEVEQAYTEVRVSTPKDIFQNIKPYTKIILTEQIYNLSEINITQFQSEYVRAENAFDGYEFIIHDVDHVEICSAPNVMAEIVTPGAHVNPIYLEKCNNIKLDGIVSGHTVEKGSCSGAVVQLDQCENITLNDCHLYGSGIYGIVSYNSKDVTVNNSEIYDCSYGLLDLNNSSHFTFNNCTFRDSEEYDMFCIRYSDDITFNNCTITGNRCVEGCVMVVSNDSTNVNFNKCIFTNNKYDHLAIGNGVEFTACKLDDQDYEGQSEYYYDYEYYEDSDYDYDDYYYDIEDEDFTE